MEGLQGPGATSASVQPAAPTQDNAADRSSKKFRTLNTTRGRGSSVPPKAAGRGRPPAPSAAAPSKPEPSQVGRQSQGLGRTLMSKAARAAAPSTTRASRADAGLAGPAGWSGAAYAGPGADTEDGFAGTFAKELPAMMYGFGDDESPLQETVDVVEAALLQYLSTVAQRALAVSQSSLKARPDEKDVLFVVRKDPGKFARIKELLLMKELIQDARTINKTGMDGGE